MGANQDLNDTIEKILVGAYDLHVHSGPDPAQPRRVDALDTARHAQEAELGGFVLKSHHYTTAPLAHALNRVYPGLTVFGSVTLNAPVGGINPAAVEAAALVEAKVVWMPTRDAMADGGTLTVFDENGELTQEAQTVLDLAVEHRMIVASGHLSAEETISLFQSARSGGADSLIATHPMASYTPDQVKEVASLGAYIEHTFVACMPSGGDLSPADLMRNIRSATVERSILTSDFGQWQNPPPAEGLRMAIAALLDEGLTADELETLVKHNPARLLEASE